MMSAPTRSSLKSLRGGDGEKHDYLANLLQSAQHVAGLTSDLPAADPCHRGETARDQQRRHQAGRQTEADHEHRDAEHGRRDGARPWWFARLCARSVRPRWRNEAHEGRHGRTCGGVSCNQSRCHQSGPTQAREHANAQHERQHQRADAVSADAAVTHDLQLALARRPAAEAVGHIGEPILMQGTSHRHGRHDGKRGGRKVRHMQDVHQPIDGCADSSDCTPDDRRRPQRARHVAFDDRGRRRKRHPRQEDRANVEFGGPLTNPIGKDHDLTFRRYGLHDHQSPMPWQEHRGVREGRA
jgi:hypothetical protein